MVCPLVDCLIIFIAPLFRGRGGVMFGPAQVRMKKTDQGFRFLNTIVVVSLISMPYEKADNGKIYHNI